MIERRAKTPKEEIDRFVQSCEVGRLATFAADGMPHVGLYRFRCPGSGGASGSEGDDTLEVHLPAGSPQLGDLEDNRRCVFELDGPVAPQDPAAGAVRYRRKVLFDCIAFVDRDPHARLVFVSLRVTARRARFAPERRRAFVAAPLQQELGLDGAKVG